MRKYVNFEDKSYPLAGLFVSAIIDSIGLENVMSYLYNASQYNWEEKSKKAGTSPKVLQESFVQKANTAR